MAQNLIHFTDTAFLGRVVEIALGGGALGGIFYLAVYMLGLGFGQGEQIVVARRYGENKPIEIGDIVNQSFLFLLGLSVVAFVILRYGSILILNYGVKSVAVHQATMAFLKYRSFGIFFAFVNVVFRSFYIGLGRTKIISYNTFLLAVSNIIRSIYVILMIPIWGYATASNTLVSYLIGQGDSKQVMKLIYKIAC